MIEVRLETRDRIKDDSLKIVIITYYIFIIPSISLLLLLNPNLYLSECQLNSLVAKITKPSKKPFSILVNKEMSSSLSSACCAVCSFEICYGFYFFNNNFFPSSQIHKITRPCIFAAIENFNAFLLLFQPTAIQKEPQACHDPYLVVREIENKAQFLSLVQPRAQLAG